MYCRCNPDDELRRLEREAAGGDRVANRKMYVARARTGDIDAQIRTLLWSLADALEEWVNRDGRIPLRGEHTIEIEGEPSYRNLFHYQSEVYFNVQTNMYHLRWTTHFEIDDEHLDEWQQTLKDQRLLRPFNELEIEVRLTTLLEDFIGTSIATVSPTVLPGVFVDTVTCEFRPALIRVGPTYHSGWEPYPFIRWRDDPDPHPIFEVINILRRHLELPNEPVVISAVLYRQSGPP